MEASGAAAVAATPAPAPSTRRKSRRATLVLFCVMSCSFIAFLLGFRWRAVSRRQRKRFRFYFYEHPAERSYSAIKIGGLGPLQIGKETPDPGRQMLLENLLVGALWRRQAATENARHDLAQRRGVIFRLGVVLGAFDSERAEIGAQPRQRTLVQEAGEIVGSVGQQFAAAESDEQVEILALDPLDGGLAGGLCERCMRDTERR